MAYRSGQFPIYQNINNYNEFQSDAVIFNNNVVVISSWGLDGGIDLVETVFPLKDLIAQNPDNPTEPINDQKLKSGVSWTSTDILTGTNSNKPALAALPALNADTLFTFYSSRNFPDLSYAGIRAIRYHLDDSDQNKDNHWSPVIALLDSDGANMPVPAFDVELSSKVVGDNIVIVACASASQQSKLGAVYDDRNKRGGTFIGVYDKTKIDLVANEWKAESSFYLPIPADIDDYDINRVMIEWIQKIGTTLEYELLVVTASKKMDANNFSHKMLASTAQMTISDKGGVTLSNFAPVAGTGDDANPVKFSNDQRPPAPYFMATLQRDPAGRLRSWFSTGNNADFVCYNVDTSTAGILLFIPTKNTLQPTAWSGYSVSPSSALTYIASEGQYKGTIPAPKAGNPDLKTNNYPVYEFVFYGEYPICQVNRIATIQTVTDPDDNPRVINLQKTKDSMDPVYIIGGIFNGPIPYPIENYRNYSPGTGELSAGTVTYGTNSKTVKGRKMAKSVAFGFEAELKTTEGVGPNFKMSFQAGTGSVGEQTTELDLISNVTQEANVVFDEELKNPSAEKQGVIKKMSVTMKVTAYSYLDEYGESIIATERSFSNTGMSGGTIEIGYDDSGDFLTFEPYDVIPGDLTSYMPEEINKLMTEKYQYKGSKYGYRDDNYFGDVICQNALPMDGKNYLEMSWDSAGKIKSGFTEIDRSYQENSWTYDGSIYAGVGGGGGFDLFGVGEKMEFSAMAGVDLSRDYSTSAEQQTEWGVDISDPWGPPSPGESAGPKAVKHYVFRLYFLPVPQKPSILPANHWTQELFDFLPANDELLAKIDKASACWKIYYVVTDIIYHDGTEISYNSKLDKQTIYDDDTLRGFGNVSN